MSARHLGHLHRTYRWQCWAVLLGAVLGLAMMVATTERASAQECYWISDWEFDWNTYTWNDYGYWWCPVYGCTDPAATNYNPGATADDGSCQYPPPPPVYGCTDPNATNYNPSATANDGSCQYPQAMNYSFSTYATAYVSGSAIVSVFDGQDYSTGYSHTDWSDAYVSSPSRSASATSGGFSASASLPVGDEEGDWTFGGHLYVLCPVGHAITVGFSLSGRVSRFHARWRNLGPDARCGGFNRFGPDNCYTPCITNINPPDGYFCASLGDPYARADGWAFRLTAADSGLV